MGWRQLSKAQHNARAAVHCSDFHAKPLPPPGLRTLLHRLLAAFPPTQPTFRLDGGWDNSEQGGHEAFRAPHPSAEGQEAAGISSLCIPSPNAAPVQAGWGGEQAGGQLEPSCA